MGCLADRGNPGLVEHGQAANGPRRRLSGGIHSHLPQMMRDSWRECSNLRRRIDLVLGPPCSNRMVERRPDYVLVRAIEVACQPVTKLRGTWPPRVARICQHYCNLDCWHFWKQVSYESGIIDIHCSRREPSLALPHYSGFPPLVGAKSHGKG